MTINVLETASGIFSQYGQFFEPERRLLAPLLKIGHSDKGVFLPVGSKADQEILLVSGIVRSFVSNPEGVEVTLGFFTDQSLISPCKTRRHQGRSTLNLEALTDVTLIVLDSNAFYELMREHPRLFELSSKILEQDLLDRAKKEIVLSSYSTKEKLVYFRERHPELENRIKHSLISSFLGISPVTFSRTRSRQTLKG